LSGLFSGHGISLDHFGSGLVKGAYHLVLERFNNHYSWTSYGANIIGAAYGANIVGAIVRHFHAIKRRIILMVALRKSPPANKGDRPPCPQ